MQRNEQTAGEEGDAAERSLGAAQSRAFDRPHPIASPPPDPTEEQRRATADRIGVLATAAQHAADDLEHKFPRSAGYLRNSAAALDHLGNILRDPRLNQLASLIGDLARRHPAAMLAGTVVLGFGLATALHGPIESHGEHAVGFLAGNG